jgi:hypothetical protein
MSDESNVIASATDYTGYNSKELNGLLKERGLIPSGNKQVMIKKLIDNDKGELLPKVQKVPKVDMSYEYLGIYIDIQRTYCTKCIEFNKNLESSNNPLERLPNIPSGVSENVTLQVLQKRGDNSCTRITPTGDLFSKKYGKIEIKCFSSIGPSSFGPKCTWDKICFVDATEWLDNKYIIYRVNLSNSTDEWQNVKMNREETFGDKCEKGQRPRMAWENIRNQIDPRHIEIIFDGSFEDIAKIEPLSEA